MIKGILKNIRNFLTFWISPYTIRYLEQIRKHEAEFSLQFIKPKVKKIIEIGGGTGLQCNYFKSRGFDVDSFDIVTSEYSKHMSSEVVIYDGINLPYEDSSVDQIFSCCTLECILSLDEILKEHFRIIKDDGLCLHILPSPVWRIATSLTDLLKKFYFDNPLSPRSKSIFNEIINFKAKKWQAIFDEHGFELIDFKSGDLFYSGNAIFGERLSISTRKKLSRILGSSCNYYVLKKRLKPKYHL